jgi:hypothetical protein
MTNLHNTNTTLLYVVQRCWHSGPQQYQPLDFLRLFHTQREAEEAAYHSAHAWSSHLHNGRTDAPIKTLLLPSYPAHNPQGSSYGFIAGGTLFWVRALKATIVTARHHNVDPSHQNICHTAAYAVVTEGVVGGTGNRNSRRGTEICEGRVFGGDASSHKAAVEAMAQVQAGFRKAGNANVAVEVKMLPVGKPAEYSSGNFLKDWPAQVLQPTSMTDAEVDLQALHKRHCDDDTFWVNQEEEGMVVDCPFEMPSAKRRRFEASSNVSMTTITPSSSIGGLSVASEVDNSAHLGRTDIMFQGQATGGLVVMRGGVFVGSSTGGYSPTNGSNDVAMM